MRRAAFFMLIPLFALFCCALPGSAAAATGTAPTVAGGFPPLVGATLTATPYTTGDPITWATCGTYQIGSADTDPQALSYTLAASDAGTDVCAYELDPLLGVVTGISDPVGPVGYGPSLSGAGGPVIEGQTLTVTQGAWGGASVTDVWKDCDASGACARVASAATGTTYVVARSDVGSMIEVVETGTRADGTHASLTTAPTGVANATPPVITAPPAVSGTAQVGAILTVSPGTWTNQPTSYTYQWERCSSGVCTPIQGATTPTYVPVGADVGDTLEAFVTGVVVGVAGRPTRPSRRARSSGSRAHRPRPRPRPHPRSSRSPTRVARTRPGG